MSLHGSGCFGLCKAKHAGLQFNAQNGGTIEKFCLSYPSLSGVPTVSVIVVAEVSHTTCKAPVFCLKVVEYGNNHDGFILLFNIRPSLRATYARLS